MDSHPSKNSLRQSSGSPDLTTWRQQRHLSCPSCPEKLFSDGVVHTLPHQRTDAPKLGLCRCGAPPLFEAKGEQSRRSGTTSRKHGMYYLFRLIFIERRCSLKIKSLERKINIFSFYLENHIYFVLLKWSIKSKYSAAFKLAFRSTWCDTWKLKDSRTGSHPGRDDAKRCNQIKIML